MSLSRTETAWGAFYRRLAYRVGKPKAITATARTIAPGCCNASASVPPTWVLRLSTWRPARSPRGGCPEN